MTSPHTSGTDAFSLLKSTDNVERQPAETPQESP